MRHRSVVAAIGACVALATAGTGASRQRDVRGDIPSDAPSASAAIPILMYHVIADPPAGALYPELYVGRSTFLHQLDWLETHGFHAVTLRSMADHWERGWPLPTHPIVLTFDDGYRSQVVTAMPALRRRGWPGVLNLTVRNTKDFWGIPPAEAQRLIAAGWEIDSHTFSHPDLRQLGDTELEHEVAGSRARLHHLLGVPIDFFCYPSGRVDARVATAVRKAGYVGATTTDFGLARPDHMYRLSRIRISRSDGVDGLAGKLRALD